jgi:hypothetical protein
MSDLFDMFRKDMDDWLHGRVEIPELLTHYTDGQVDPTAGWDNVDRVLDNRDPQQLGEALRAIRAKHPEMKLSELAERVDRGEISIEMVAPVYLNGKSHLRFNLGELHP